MKFYLLAVVTLLLCVVSTEAQTVSSKIMDANITWTQNGNQYNGQLNVYLTDTIGIAGLNIMLGTTPDASDLLSTQYTIAASSNFWNTGTIDANNVLHIPIGSYTYHEDYYAKLNVILDNSTSDDIAIHSSN